MRRWLPPSTNVSSLPSLSSLSLSLSLPPKISRCGTLHSVGSGNNNNNNDGDLRFQLLSQKVQQIRNRNRRPAPLFRGPGRRTLASTTSTRMGPLPNGGVLSQHESLFHKGNSYQRSASILLGNLVHERHNNNTTTININSNSNNRDRQRRNHGTATNPTTTAVKNPTTTTIESKWRDMTERILDLPVGSFDQGRWNEAITVLTHWFGNGNTSASGTGSGTGSGSGSNTAIDKGVAVETCWRILDRLCRELEAEAEAESVSNRSRRKEDHQTRTRTRTRTRTPIPVLSTMEVLNPILVLWRDAFLVHHNRGNKLSRTTTGLPSEISRKLRWYEANNLVRMDTATHAIVLDVAGKHSSSTMGTRRGGAGGPHHDHDGRDDRDEQQHKSRHNQGVWFADRYLRDWVDDYNKITTSLSNTSYNYNNNQQQHHHHHQHQHQHQQRFQSRRIPALPDIVAFGTVIHAWVESGLPDAPIRAEEWLEAWDDFQKQQTDETRDTASPTLSSQGITKDSKRNNSTNIYTFILLAWARAGNPVRVRKWMDRMIQEGVHPDVKSFNCLLMAYQTAASTRERFDPTEKKRNRTPNHESNQKCNAECAEDVLKHMQQLYHDKDGFLSEPPNVASYNIVIDAWTKQVGSGSSTPTPTSRKRDLDMAHRAHEWMERMKVAGIQPNTITYNTVITAYSRAGQPLYSEKVLKELIAAYQNDKPANDSLQQDDGTTPIDDKSMDTDSARDLLSFENYACITTTKPDVQSFTSVLAGWARVGTFEAAQRAEELLRVMQRRDVDIRPNVETFGACIHCWARAAAGVHANRHRGQVGAREQQQQQQQQAEAVQRAEALFREMRDKYNIRPDVYAYTGLLNAYGRSGRAQMADDFLEACLSEYDATKDPQMRPTVVTFTAILNAWSKAKGFPEAARKAHRLLLRMEEQYGIRPNAFSYSAVLDAYARSTLPDAADKALCLFHDMRDVAGLEPTAYTCTNVLKAMARGGRMEEAEALLYKLIYDKCTSAKLGPHAFSSVLYGWSKSKRTDAPERAEKLLIKMQELYLCGMIDGPPNAVCCNSVLACWAHSKLPGAAQRAEDLLRHIDQEQERRKHHLAISDLADSPKQRSSRLDIGESQELPAIRCNRIMYNTVINAWANQGNFSKANDLYRELLEKSKVNTSLAPPDEWTYRALWKAIIKSNQIGPQEKLNRMQKLMQLMTDSGLDLSNHMQDDIERIRQQQP